MRGAKTLKPEIEKSINEVKGTMKCGKEAVVRESRLWNLDPNPAQLRDHRSISNARESLGLLLRRRRRQNYGQGESCCVSLNLVLSTDHV